MSAPFPRLALSADELRHVVPAELVLRPQWVAWRVEIRDHKPTKVPLNARGGGRASSTDPASWATFDEAVAFHARTPASHGLGFVFTAADPFAGIDLDHCIDEAGALKPWAAAIVERFPGAYVERSPSGTGVKLFVRGRTPHNGRRSGYPEPRVAVEMYDHGRYFTVTGDAHGAPPATIADANGALAELAAAVFPAKLKVAPPAASNRGLGLADADVIEHARRASNGAKFSALWAGDTSAHHGDASSADLALLNMLACYTDNDPAQLNRLFRRSGLYREKWERADYRDRTIAKALAGRVESCAPLRATFGAAVATNSVAPPPLEKVVAAFTRWLRLDDVAPLLAVLATVAANLHLDGDPLWLLFVGPSGSGKTEILRALTALPHVHQAATLSEPALLSGTPQRDRTKDASGGLLRQVGERGIVVFKDFTSILAQNNEARGPALAALREVYDGAWTRCVGVDGGRTLTWTGHLGILAGCTPTYDRYYSVTAALGERFLIVRTGHLERRELASRALGHRDRETAMRAELSAAVSGLFAAPGPAPVALNDGEHDLIVGLADFVARARSPVERDRGNREIELIPDAEAPTRLAGALARLRDGLLSIGTPPPVALRVVARVARDSIPALRRAALEALRCGERGTTAVAVALAHPTGTVRRTLEDLAGHGLVKRTPIGRGKADMWALDKNVAREMDTFPAIPSIAEKEIKEAPVDLSAEPPSAPLPELRERCLAETAGGADA